MQDPQSLHKYAYVHGNPVQGVDPTGEFLAGLGISIGAFALRTGKELGYSALATTALYSALGGGAGAAVFKGLGENPWLGAYNGALIGASVRIGYLAHGGWNGVGKVAFDGSVAAVSRFMVEFSWSLYNETLEVKRY